MSGGTLFSHLLGSLASSGMPERTRSRIHDVLYSMDAPFPQFIYEAGIGAGLDRRRLLDRGAAIILEYAAVQLCDDLADGDCDYLDQPYRTGPVTLAIIQTFFFRLIAAADIRPAVLTSALARLCSAGSAQLSELCTSRWTLARSYSAAAGLNGKQISAYLSLLWSGTACECFAHRVGYNLGIAIHVVSDKTANDPRYGALTLREQHLLVARARRSLRIVNSLRLPFLRNFTASLDKNLGA